MLNRVFTTAAQNLNNPCQHNFPQSQMFSHYIWLFVTAAIVGVKFGKFLVLEFTQMGILREDLS